MSDLTAAKPVLAEPKPTQAEKLLMQLGPGLLTGAADDIRTFRQPYMNVSPFLLDVAHR
jgi:hypothetical protein